MMRFLFVIAFLLHSTSVWCEFYEAPEDVPEEHIYPAETYETETGNIQLEQELFYSPEETPSDEDTEQDTGLYDMEGPVYDQE